MKTRPKSLYSQANLELVKAQSLSSTGKGVRLRGRGGKGREGKGREGKGREGKARQGKAEGKWKGKEKD